jgi:hypothetical protein
LSYGFLNLFSNFNLVFISSPKVCFASYLLFVCVVDLKLMDYFRLYYTSVKLGTPPSEYNVQIDTGSDVLWVTAYAMVVHRQVDRS